MRILIWTLLLFLKPSLPGSAVTVSQAGSSSAIFQCSTTSENYVGRFILTETGEFKLAGRKGEKAFNCDLTLSELSKGHNDQVPNVTFRMSPKNCTDQDAGKYLVQKMSLVVTKNLKARAADIQWITYLQPSPCVIERYDVESIRRAADRFSKGIFQ